MWFLSSAAPLDEVTRWVCKHVPRFYVPLTPLARAR